MLKDKKGKDVDKVYRLKYQLCFCFTRVIDWQILQEIKTQHSF